MISFGATTWVLLRRTLLLYSWESGSQNQGLGFVFGVHLWLPQPRKEQGLWMCDSRSIELCVVCSDGQQPSRGHPSLSGGDPVPRNWGWGPQAAKHTLCFQVTHSLSPVYSEDRKDSESVCVLHLTFLFSRGFVASPPPPPIKGSDWAQWPGKGGGSAHCPVHEGSSGTSVQHQISVSIILF